MSEKKAEVHFDFGEGPEALTFSQLADKMTEGFDKVQKCAERINESCTALKPDVSTMLFALITVLGFGVRAQTKTVESKLEMQSLMHVLLDHIIDSPAGNPLDDVDMEMPN